MSDTRTFQHSYETTKLRRAMLDAGLDSPTLALKLGVHKRTLQNLVSGNGRSWPLRSKINAFFKSQIFDPAFCRPRGVRRRYPSTNTNKP
jgi:hypothetical protein